MRATLLLLAALAGLAAAPAYGQLSDSTGLINRLYVDVGRQEFEVQVTANFDVPGAEFDLEGKALSMSIASSLEDNLGEIAVPKALLGGDIAVILDGGRLDPDIRSNDRIWFITVEFGGAGAHTLEITGTESAGRQQVGMAPGADMPEGAGGGCLVATAAYGSEMASRVQELREIRDGKVLATESGRAFMSAFNRVYYSFSPAVADWERQSPAFREIVRAAIAPMLGTLLALDRAGAGSEAGVLGYGAGIVALNAGICAAPPLAAAAAVRSVLGKKRPDKPVHVAGLAERDVPEDAPPVNRYRGGGALQREPFERLRRVLL